MSRYVRFESTIWTVIHSAGARRESACNDLLKLYRPPVVRYLKARGVDETSAEDLAQEVFLRLFEKDLLGRLETEGGKFRSFLLAVTNNIWREHRERQSARKRGGGEAPLSLDANPTDVAAGEERDFTREWMLHLVRLALEKMARAASQAVRRDLELFRGFLWERRPYEELAGRYGVSVTAVKNGIYETKQRLRREVGRLVNSYTCNVADFREEMTAFDRQGMSPADSPGR